MLHGLPFRRKCIQTLLIIFSIGPLAAYAYAQALPRLPRTIDDLSISRLAGTTHPEARPENDVGRAAADLPLNRILLVLKSSSEQQAQLESLLAAQQDPASPQFHKWLTPQEFGQQFGIAQQDIDTISRWLTRMGLQVGTVANGRRTIEFSGSASQVERAFHTEMHYYLLNGTRHLANSTDIAIPSALASVVSGVASLYDFYPVPLHSAFTAISLAPVSERGARP